MAEDLATVLLLDEAGNTLLARAATGLDNQVKRRVRFRVGQGFAGRIAAKCRVIALEVVDHANLLNPLLWEKEERSLLRGARLVEARVLGVVHAGTLSPRRLALQLSIGTMGASVAVLTRRRRSRMHPSPLVAALRCGLPAEPPEPR